MKNVFLVAFAFATVALGACNQEDDIQNVAPSGPYASLAAALNENTALAQTYNIDADSGGSFVATRGTRFLFPKRAFLTPGGDTVQGTVQVTIREYLDRGEMIFSRVLPVSGTMPLLTAGEFFTSAVQSGKTVQLRLSKPYTVFLPQRNFITPASGLGPFLGVIQEIPGSGINWIPSGYPASIIASDIDTVATTADTLGFYQPAVANEFFNYQGQDAATVKFSMGGVGGLDDANSFLFVLPKGLREVIPIGGAKAIGKLPFVGRKDVEVNVVAIAVVNGYFYGGTSTAKIEDGKTLNVDLKEYPPSIFKAAITALL